MAGITSAVIGAATAVYGASQAKKQQKAQEKLSREAIEAADPYRKYRPAAAEKLNALMADPSSIESTPEYKARLQAAARQLAAQGYTGSGNAIIEAANAGGSAYQQAFDNLAILSGANVAPGGNYGAALSANANANDNYLSSLSGVANNLTNLTATIGGSRFNVSAPTNSSTYSYSKGFGGK